QPVAIPRRETLRRPCGLIAVMDPLLPDPAGSASTQRTRHRRPVDSRTRLSTRILLAAAAALGLALVGYVLAGGFAEVMPTAGATAQSPSAAGTEPAAQPSG